MADQFNLSVFDIPT